MKNTRKTWPSTALRLLHTRQASQSHLTKKLSVLWRLAKFPLRLSSQRLKQRKRKRRKRKNHHQSQSKLLPHPSLPSDARRAKRWLLWLRQLQLRLSKPHQRRTRAAARRRRKRQLLLHPQQQLRVRRRSPSLRRRLRRSLNCGMIQGPAAVRSHFRGQRGRVQSTSQRSLSPMCI
jgi:hypothetical protein